LRGNEGNVSLAVNSAVVIYDAFIAESVNLGETGIYTRAAAEGLHRGINRALGK
jgi:hypothetical protein